MPTSNRRAQEQRSERSRSQILEAALKLFSHQGYRATSTREIAEEAGVSTGAVYHQFSEKESLFRVLLEQYFKAINSPEFPFNKALAAGAFPDDLEGLARAARESVKQFRPYVALIYVDVVEFDGIHIRKFYANMADRFETFMRDHGDTMRLDRLRPGVSPVAAIMLASRFFLHYFAVEIIFGVPNHFGRDNQTVLKQIADIFQHGMLRPESESRGRKRKAPRRRPSR